MARKDWSRRLRSVLGGAGLAAAITVPSLAEEQTAVGELTIVPTDSGYRITASVDGRGTAMIDADLTVLKDDESGRIQTRQSRQVQTEPGARDEIATSTVSMSDTGTLEVTLSLSEGDRAVYRVTHRITRDIPD